MLQRRNAPDSESHGTALTESSRFTLRLEQAEDVVFADRALDVANDRAGSVVHELDTNLGNTTTGASAAENFYDLCELYRSLSSVLFRKFQQR